MSLGTMIDTRAVCCEAETSARRIAGQSAWKKVEDGGEAMLDDGSRESWALEISASREPNTSAAS